MDPVSLLFLLTTGAALLRQAGSSPAEASELANAWTRLLSRLEREGEIPEDLLVIVDKMIEENREPPNHAWHPTLGLIPFPRAEDVILDHPPNVEIFWVSGTQFAPGGGTWMSEFLDDRWGPDDEPEALAEAQAELEGWYWWFCMPGCMPDSDPHGPFSAQNEAIVDSWDGSGEIGDLVERARREGYSIERGREPGEEQWWVDGRGRKMGPFPSELHAARAWEMWWE